MKIPAALVIVATVAIAAAGTASARNIEVPAETGEVVPVCVEAVSSQDWHSMIQAEGMASKMFLAAGVIVKWRSGKDCPVDSIRISLSWHSPASDHPRAYAYALPLEGVHIVLFWDRIANAGGPQALPYLAAHVLVHEVTHILQGACRHSDTGVMKTTFTGMDIAAMQTHALPFTEEDLDLIHAGMEVRRARAAH
jgi:hypothetical protein